MNLQVLKPLCASLIIIAAMLHALAGAPEGSVPQLKKIQLKNAGFEDADPKNPERPAEWQGYNWKSSDQAHSGKKALKIGGFQWAAQEFAIAPEDIGKSITVRFYAKGKGKLQFFFSLWKGSDEKRTDTFSGWQGRQEFFTLTDEYIPYSFTMKSTEGTEHMSANIGASHALDALIDDMTVEIGEQPKETVNPQSSIISPPANDTLVNIAPFAKIRTTPLGFNVGRMVDGIPYSGLSLLENPSGSAPTYEFIYDKPQIVSGIRYSLPSKSFVLWADSTGNGRYDKLLALEPRFPSDKCMYWNVKEWSYYSKGFKPPIKVYAIKLVPYYKANAVFEMEILAPSKTVSKDMQAPVIPNDIASLEAGTSIPLPQPKPEERYIQGYHVEPWMYGSEGGYKDGQERKPLAEWPGFRKMMDDLKRGNCTFMWLFPPKTWVPLKDKDNGGGGTYPYEVMWPSKYCRYSSEEHLLKEFCDEARKEGMTVSVRDREFVSKVVRPEGTPETTIFSWAERETMKGMGLELAAEGVDIMPLCVDEAQFRGAMYPNSFLRLIAEDPKKSEEENKKIRAHNKQAETTRKAFIDRWKIDEAALAMQLMLPYPDKREDTDIYRKWVVFYFEQVADFMNGTSAHIKKTYPKAETVATFCGIEADRANWGTAFEIIGWNGDVDYLETDPYHTQEDHLGVYASSVFSKSLMAGNRKHKAIVTLNGPWAWSGREKCPLAFEVCPPVSMAGSVIGAAAQGCQGYAFWRYYNIYEMKCDKAVEQAFSMLDTMAAWGSRTASIPKDIAVLRSGASEDWWRLKYEKDLNSDPILPHESYLQLSGFLLRKGYPFELYYLDRPESFKNLKEYKLVILPFPYSIGKEAYAEIEKALKAGTKLIVMGNQGDTDQIGNAYPEPLLKKLIDEKKAEFVDDDISKVGNFPAFENKFKGMIDGILGDRKTLNVNSYGLDVQVGCLEKSDSEKFIIIINWSGKDCPVDLGIRMPEGKYKLLMRTLEGASEAKIGGKTELSAKDLSSFRVPMKNGEIIVLFTAPAK